MKRVVGRFWAVLVMVLVASLLLTGLASAEKPVRKIVVFDAAVSEVAKENIIKGAGGVVYKPLPSINAYAAWLPDRGQSVLLRTPGVVRVDDDLEAQILGKVTARKPGGGGSPQPAETEPWGVTRISADDARSVGYIGAGVKVGVIDTGISTSHPDLLTVAGGINTVGNKTPTTKYNDDNGHGSHVAGTIGARDNEIGVVGVAPGVQLYAIKVLNAAGVGSLSDVIQGLSWAKTNGMHVVNMSLGFSSGNQSLYEAIVDTVNSEVTVVAAAGNSGASSDGTSTVMWPARYEEVIAVSASNQSDEIAGFSSLGSEVDLIAPGSDILSTYKGTSYAYSSGTSMAAPHVTGAAALYIGKNLGTAKTPSDVAFALTSTADSLGLNATLQDAGLVNAYNVVAP